jgi:hypothetical protein
VPRSIRIEYAGAFYHVMARGTIGPPAFTQEMAFICQELMPDPYLTPLSSREKSRASLSILGMRVLCFVVLIDSLDPHSSRNSRFD